MKNIHDHDFNEWCLYYRMRRMTKTLMLMVQKMKTMMKMMLRKKVNDLTTFFCTVFTVTFSVQLGKNAQIDALFLVCFCMPAVCFFRVLIHCLISDDSEQRGTKRKHEDEEEESWKCYHSFHWTIIIKRQPLPHSYPITDHVTSPCELYLILRSVSCKKHSDWTLCLHESISLDEFWIHIVWMPVSVFYLILPCYLYRFAEKRASIGFVLKQLY